MSTPLQLLQGYGNSLCSFGWVAGSNAVAVRPDMSTTNCNPDTPRTFVLILPYSIWHHLAMQWIFRRRDDDMTVKVSRKQFLECAHCHAMNRGRKLQAGSIDRALTLPASHPPMRLVYLQYLRLHCTCHIARFGESGLAQQPVTLLPKSKH